jgi:hypothetical protein
MHGNTQLKKILSLALLIFEMKIFRRIYVPNVHFILWMNILAVTGFKLLAIVELFVYVLKFYLDTILYSQCTIPLCYAGLL